MRVLLVERLLAADRPLGLRELLRTTPALPSDVIACLTPLVGADLLAMTTTNGEVTWRVPEDGGANRFLAAQLKPFRRLPSTLRKLADHAVSDLVGDGPKMRVVLEQIRLAARTDVPVLITGETGTGKELVARAIHALGTRSDRAFVALNAAAIPLGLFESELFGHERGAFTGALRRRAGALERADGGTLFLDEVGDLDPGAQAKLLRVLQDFTYVPVGSDRERRAHFRLLTATHRSLEQRVEDRGFREDFLYRINVIGIHLPSLRERPEDLPALAMRFVERNVERFGVPAPSQVSPSALDLLVRHGWPGNVRELEAVIARAALLANGGVLTAEAVSAALRMVVESADVARPTRAVPATRPLRKTQLERISTALVQSGGNVMAAARAVGISKVTFYRYLVELERMDPGLLERTRAGAP